MKKKEFWGGIFKILFLFQVKFFFFLFFSFFNFCSWKPCLFKGFDREKRIPSPGIFKILFLFQEILFFFWNSFSFFIFHFQPLRKKIFDLQVEILFLKNLFLQGISISGELEKKEKDHFYSYCTAPAGRPKAAQSAARVPPETAGLTVRSTFAIPGVSHLQLS